MEDSAQPAIKQAPIWTQYKQIKKTGVHKPGTLAEWLTRWPAILSRKLVAISFGSVCSNHTGVAICLFFFVCFTTIFYFAISFCNIKRQLLRYVSCLLGINVLLLMKIYYTVGQTLGGIICYYLGVQNMKLQ